jgi:hypothetical protein
MDWWHTLTEPQATLIAGLLTLASGILVAIIAPLIVGSKFSDVRQASEEARKLMESTKIDLDAFKHSINFELEELKKSFSQVRYAVGEARNDIAEATSKDEAPTQGMPPKETKLNEELKDTWSEIRDRLEEIAANPAIDRQSRDKYNRIDRRTFQRLIEALDADNRLGLYGPNLMEAVNLWHKYRSGRLPVSLQDLARMKELRDRFLSR